MKAFVKLSALLTALVVLLCSCGAQETDFRQHAQEYVKEMEYRDGFTILQLTDIHWSNTTQVGNGTYGSSLYLKKVVEEAKKHAGRIDLIEITGDTFMLATPATVTTFIDIMEQIGIPYAMAWGNHDREGRYNPNWLSEMFLRAEHCVYIEVDNDNVHDRSNYVINLTENGKTVWQIFNLDSGASYREGSGDLLLDYDYFRDDQFAWMSMQHEAVGATVPALCYYHIPQADNDLAFAAVGEERPGYKYKFFKTESFAASDRTRPTAEIFKKNHVVGCFMGHAHAVDWTVTTPDGITYGLGVKTGKELYYGSVSPENYGEIHPGFAITESFDLIGASLVTLKDTSGKFDLEHLYYNERKDGDFSLWVSYND